MPKESTTARPPIDGYAIQLSSNISGFTTSIIEKQFPNTTTTLGSPTDLRLFNFIAGATWSSNVATIDSELPHPILKLVH